MNRLNMKWKRRIPGGIYSFIAIAMFGLAALAMAQDSATTPGADLPPLDGPADAPPADPAQTTPTDASPQTQAPSAATTSSNASVRDLGFQWQQGDSKLQIVFDGPVTAEQSVSEADKQVIIDIKGARINKKWARRIDTSQHKSNVSLISPYQSPDGVRIVLQLKENGPVQIQQEGNTIVALIANSASGKGATDTQQIAAEPATPVATPETAPEAAPSADQAAAEPAKSAAQSSGGAVDEFMEAHRTRSYVGKGISLQVRDADLASVFQIISDASEFNIVVSEEVKGKITMNLSDVPWDQALDLILHTQKLGAERQGNILRITSLDALAKEKEAEAMAKKAMEQAEPLVVKIFPVSYAHIEDLKKIITDFLSKDDKASGNRGTINVDTRTNSLVVRETPSTMEKIKRIVKELDTQTPQILIEAKFVEVKETNSKEVQGRIFASTREANATGNIITPPVPTKDQFGAFFGGSQNLVPTQNFSISSPTTGGATFGFQPQFGLLPGLKEIGAFLSILESESRAKIIASPRVVAQNKEAAEITQGSTAQYSTAGGANVAGGIATVSLMLKMTVTPQVTNDGSVSMKVEFSQDSPAAQNLANSTLTTDSKKVSTNVLIDSGSTLVIGGVYSSDTVHSEAGIPLLRDLPLIGFLFGGKSDVGKKSELFIFLTPRIVNEKEAGFKG